ncbi:cyclase family protein [Segniliparus rugosus]|uniref:Kynurenine formamidase n=1 Tax=Segniliparus rugosus (strain ATCC BAA-974 / DSM 45345 / CCUG 50838 / CIP 108380 / JCM 13579 / CDC 945) TaxID=679197 RepID=E5XKV5_SEGRC|nr:cyclase family protein [Segniliparus rugosus]EFV15018.1 hypothetical protein HMPREF9336_00124 [Segniliparus rugosus ATCC BAA-974]
MAQYRAVFDAKATFSNGGSLSVEGFRLDVPSPGATEDEVAALFVASLGLLMTEEVEFGRLSIIEEPHKGTRGGPSGLAAPAVRSRRVDLNHVIRHGETTYPGLPAPQIAAHLTRAASRGLYAEGVEFQIDQITMVGNTGTYLDSPFHRYHDGPDLSSLSLDRLVDLPAVVVRAEGDGARAVDVGHLAALEVEGRAVLLHTGGDRHWGTPAYAVQAPYLTERAARWLAERKAALVGIDSVNIDAIDQGKARPAHSVLLAAGIPIVEHLTGLGQLPPHGATFTAVPPRVEGFGTFPVRAFATVETR